MGNIVSTPFKYLLGNNLANTKESPPENAPDVDIGNQANLNDYISDKVESPLSVSQATLLSSSKEEKLSDQLSEEDNEKEKDREVTEVNTKDAENGKDDTSHTNGNETEEILIIDDVEQFNGKDTDKAYFCLSSNDKQMINNQKINEEDIDEAESDNPPISIEDDEQEYDGEYDRNSFSYPKKNLSELDDCHTPYNQNLTKHLSRRREVSHHSSERAKRDRSTDSELSQGYPGYLKPTDLLKNQKKRQKSSDADSTSSRSDQASTISIGDEGMGSTKVSKTKRRRLKNRVWVSRS